MKKLLICGLVVLLMGCVVPVSALTAVADNIRVFNCDPGGGFDGPQYVLKNDFPQSPSLKAELIKLPAFGTLRGLQVHEFLSQGGFVDYVPNDPQFFGTDHFAYRACDGSICSNTVLVSIDVLAYPGYAGKLPYRPVDIYLTTPKDTPLSTDNIDYLWGWGFWDLSITSPPSHGVITPIPNGAVGLSHLVYTPNPGFTGWDTFNFESWEDTVSYGLCYGAESRVRIYVGDPPYPTPEFPSVLLPATMIIGFLGAVLLIQRTKER